MLRLLLVGLLGAAIAVVGFAAGTHWPLARRAPPRQPTSPRTATTQPTTRKSAPVAAKSSTGDRSLPTWAIVGFTVAALLIGGGITGIFTTRR